jgi:hypothetical protein
MVFKFFGIFNVSKSTVLFKLLLASMKTLSYYGYFIASESPPLPLQRDWRQLKEIVTLNSAFENADSQSSTCCEN